MKAIISINKKFMEVSPKKLIEMISNTKYVKGIEINIDSSSDFELNYLHNLVFELKKNNMILQIHGNSDLSLEEQFKYLIILEDYSKYLGYTVLVNMHPIYDENKDESIIKTSDYMSNIINEVDSSKLKICIENLNDMDNRDRLSKEEIIPIVVTNKLLYFTYDMGHELMDYGHLVDFDNGIISKIANVHVHTNNGKADHMPIYKNDVFWNELLKGVKLLVKNKYQNNIVYEYDLYECNGNSIEEKIHDYLKSIDLFHSMIDSLD